MILHTDIPTRAQVDRLLVNRDPASVSIYVATDPTTANQPARIKLRNLSEAALGQLRDAGIANRAVAAIEEELGDLVDDEVIWRNQARSLAAFVTPEFLFTFRLPNRLLSNFEVSDRFHLKPLLRAVTFPQVAFVLALARGSVRVIEVSADDPPSEIKLPDMPSDAASAAGRSSLADRAPTRRIQGAEGLKIRLRQYARQIDQAMRPFLNGLDVPLILAATEPLESIFRSMNSYPHLAATGIAGNPERTPDAELAASARGVLDALYAEQLRATHELFERRSADGRALLDVGDVARAATYGAVDTVFVDIDQVVPGTIDEQSGAVSLASTSTSDRYGVVDEIARRTWLAGGTVLAVRSEDIPGKGPVAAILRYRIG
jgi:Bacterial archaeo-eukaryotic release factor family 11